jgi:hypothetical protein
MKVSGMLQQRQLLQEDGTLPSITAFMGTVVDIGRRVESRSTHIELMVVLPRLLVVWLGLLSLNTQTGVHQEAVEGAGVTVAILDRLSTSTSTSTGVGTAVLSSLGATERMGVHGATHAMAATAGMVVVELVVGGGGAGTPAPLQQGSNDFTPAACKMQPPPKHPCPTSHQAAASMMQPVTTRHGSLMHGARFSTEFSTCGCHLFPCLLA